MFGMVNLNTVSPTVPLGHDWLSWSPADHSRVGLALDVRQQGSLQLLITRTNTRVNPFITRKPEELVQPRIKSIKTTIGNTPESPEQAPLSLWSTDGARAAWQIKVFSLFVDLYKHNMKLVILLRLLKLVSRNICKEEQIT